jgi:integrase/recombinase XerC
MPAHRHPVEVVSPLLDSYRARLVLSGVTPATLNTKMTTLHAFARTMAPRGLEDATRADCETFLTSRPLAPESRRAYRSTLRGLYTWAWEEGLVAEDVTARIPAVRVPRRAPRPMSQTDLDRALAGAGGRMKAWLMLMALGGLRCIEVSGLRPQDLQHTPDGVLLFLRLCKGGGSATVPAHPLILEALAALPIRDGLWWSCNRVTISAQVNDHLRACGVDSTAHSLRHWAATSWYKWSGHDLLTTQALMRHATVSSTQIYAATDPTRPRQVVDLVPLRLVPGAVA